MNLYTAERMDAQSTSDNPIFQRHLVAYNYAQNIVKQNVLEIGCGDGYGIPMLAQNCTQYTAIDKFTANLNNLPQNAQFIQMNVPNLKPFADNTFDFVVSFQVIEHIEDDHTFLSEIHRVLKPNGKLLFTTPNKDKSLTRNPWHVREYNLLEMNSLIKKYFQTYTLNGIFAGEKMIEYYEKNKKTIQKITQFDILNLQYRLPRTLLQIPYDLANRLNRIRLKNDNTTLVDSISTKDFFVQTANENCLDWLAICQK